MIITPEALDGFRIFIAESVSYAEYQAGGNWMRIPLNSVDILPDGRITVTITLGTGFTEPIVITGIRIYSVIDMIVAETAENISCKSPEEGILYRFRFNVQEVE